MKRLIKISIMAPVTVVVVVDSDTGTCWEVTEIINERISTSTPQSIMENADQATFDEIDRLASAAPEYRS